MSSFVDTAYDAGAFDRGTEPVLRIFSVDQAKQVVQYQADDQLRQRIEQLADKNSTGEITAEELAEYEGYVRANKFVAILQAQARKRLANSRA